MSIKCTQLWGLYQLFVHLWQLWRLLLTAKLSGLLTENSVISDDDSSTASQPFSASTTKTTTTDLFKGLAPSISEKTSNGLAAGKSYELNSVYVSSQHFGPSTAEYAGYLWSNVRNPGDTAKTDTQKACILLIPICPACDWSLVHFDSHISMDGMQQPYRQKATDVFCTKPTLYLRLSSL